MFKKNRIGIVGQGMVGGTIKRYFESVDKYKLYLNDSALGYYNDVNKADIIFICVPTPANNEGYDLSSLKKALSTIESGKIVVIKSTILPGTCRHLDKMFNLKILFNPEFLSEATADKDFRNPYLQVVGGETELAKKVLRYLPKGKEEMICSWEVAESIKIVRNVLSATKLVILNEIYDILQKAGVDYEKGICQGVESLAKIPSFHLRVIHKGGRGAGGKCLQKELKAFKNYAKKVDRPSELLDLANEINTNLLKTYPKNV